MILLLSIFSLLAVYSSTGSLAYRFQGGNTSYYILKHATILAMGIVITYVTHLIPYKYFSRIAQVLLVLAIPLLMVTLIFGVTRNQASRWLSVPGLGLTFQTSDIAKLAIVMYIARMLAKKQENIKDFKTAFKPIVIPLMLVCLLVLAGQFIHLDAHFCHSLYSYVHWPYQSETSVWHGRCDHYPAGFLYCHCPFL